MNQVSESVETPAPQLPNLPVSEDDPFHLDPERSLPVTKPGIDEPDSQFPQPQSGGVTNKSKPVSKEEPEQIGEDRGTL